MSRTKLVLGFAAALPLMMWAEEKVDLSAIYRIKNEAFENSKVMDTAFYLTDVHGPRVTNSPGYRGAAEWASKRLTEYGLSNVKLETFSFGKGWSLTHFYAGMTEPQYAPLIGFPLAWSAGTNGMVSGEPMMATIRTEADIEKGKGKRKGKIVMGDPPRDLSPQMTSPYNRYSEADLEKLAMAPDPSERPMGAIPRPNGGPAPNLAQALGLPPGTPVNMESMRRIRTKIVEFLRDAGV